MSKELDEMKGTGIGFRSEMYSGGRGWRKANDVIQAEFLDYGNVDVLVGVCSAIGVDYSKWQIEDAKDWTHETIRDAARWLKGIVTDRFGYDAEAIWLTTKEVAIGRYCEAGEQPIGYAIPKDATPVVDLGEDGVLFIRRKDDTCARCGSVVNRGVIVCGECAGKHPVGAE